MAHKYIIQDVLDDALSRLKKYDTNNLAAWQDPDGRARYVTARNADAPTVIELARLTDTPTLLPTAFLACVELITQYRTNADGSYTYPAASLSVPDQVRVIEAKGRLAQTCAARVLVLLTVVPSAHCAERGICTAMGGSPPHAARHNVGPPPITDGSALQPIAEKLWGMQWQLLCRSCERALLEMDAREVKKLWRDLPSQFDLEIDQTVWLKSADWTGQPEV